MSVFEAPSSEASWPSEAEQVFAAGEAFETEMGELEGESGELESPFRSAVAFGESEGVQPAGAPPATTSLESPFQSSFSEVSESEGAAEAFRELLAELESEQFDEAVAQLVDEAAGLHLSSGASWSSGEAAPALAMSELEAWIEPLRQETHRMLDNMAERLGNEELERFRDSELEALFESLRPDTGFLPEAFENFLGGLFKKAVVRPPAPAAGASVPAGSRDLGRPAQPRQRRRRASAPDEVPALGHDEHRGQHEQHPGE